MLSGLFKLTKCPIKFCGSWFHQLFKRFFFFFNSFFAICKKNYPPPPPLPPSNTPYGPYPPPLSTTPLTRENATGFLSPKLLPPTVIWTHSLRLLHKLYTTCKPDADLHLTNVSVFLSMYTRHAKS